MTKRPKLSVERIESERELDEALFQALGLRLSSLDKSAWGPLQA